MYTIELYTQFYHNHAYRVYIYSNKKIEQLNNWNLNGSWKKPQIFFKRKLYCENDSHIFIHIQIKIYILFQLKIDRTFVPSLELGCKKTLLMRLFIVENTMFIFFKKKLVWNFISKYQDWRLWGDNIRYLCLSKTF